MSRPRVARLAVVGLGLVGGSVVRAARARQAAAQIVGVSRNAATLAEARAAGLLDASATDLAEGIRDAELVVLAAPVGALPGLVREAWPHLTPGAVLTDVGSVKWEVVGTAESCPARAGVAFVGGHPMAGSEESGFAASGADLFAGCLVLLTPTERTPEAAVGRVAAFWEALGGHVRTLGAAAHDRAVAAISHLPHLVAYGLVAAAEGEALALAGRGFVDTTRVAASPEALWSDIFRVNRSALLGALVEYRARLARWEALIRAGEWSGLEEELVRAREIREKLG
ncbi:MAG: prephenate dehydrogenase/arogenate dehydrogenase family protein [Candidatus Rokubacteria bacterium]|nr:prephenate dehydrogenase/arogenate dehydrogenase family protein [Candidatus Rokubacteria bacterium]